MQWHRSLKGPIMPVCAYWDLNRSQMKQKLGKRLPDIVKNAMPSRSSEFLPITGVIDLDPPKQHLQREIYKTLRQIASKDNNGYLKGRIKDRIEDPPQRVFRRWMLDAPFWLKCHLQPKIFFAFLRFMINGFYTERRFQK